MAGIDLEDLMERWKKEGYVAQYTDFIRNYATPNSDVDGVLVRVDGVPAGHSLYELNRFSGGHILGDVHRRHHHSVLLLGKKMCSQGIESLKDAASKVKGEAGYILEEEMYLNVSEWLESSRELLEDLVLGSERGRPYSVGESMMELYREYRNLEEEELEQCNRLFAGGQQPEAIRVLVHLLR